MFCTVLVFLTLWVSSTRCSGSCVQFELAQEVSPTESIQVISNYSAASRTELFGVCAPRCMKDIRCDAFDICNGECRTIRGWLPAYTDSGSGNVCERHQIDCDAGYYYDRQTERCVRHYYCDFELVTETSCFLSESHTDNADWTRRTGTTPYSYTGPSSAKFGSYYKYLQSAYYAGYTGILEIIEHFEDKTYCLSLYYHMYGTHMNSLIISTQNGTDTPINHWTMTGDQGNAWYRLSGLNLQLDHNTKVLITGEQGAYYAGDIGIDFVELWPFACPYSA
ncbi:MAM domain-containing glycosylphosphatidylinositol anchor protein 1-like [Magallana gigas]|uniref:MAM domain-containing glycosylphosphatidylinositol anchor protein 1-like n=1 Tax=Magallana gigas TaxID=29159 RepID=UPI00333F9AA1